MVEPGVRYDAERSFKNHRETTLKNWSDRGEIMHYAFLHLPEFFTHAIIHRSGPVSPLEYELRDDIARHEVDTRLGMMALDDYVQEGPVNGVVIVQGGRIVYESYPRMRSFDKHVLMSITKVFPSTIIGIFEDRDLVDPDHPVDHYLPELRGSGWEGIRVQDVLDMTSGIDCLEVDIEGAYTDPATCYYQYEASLDWLEKTDATFESTYDFVASLQRHREPGEVYEYSGLNTFVLSWMVERITGKLFNEAVTDELWTRIGPESDALIATSRIGAPTSHGGLSTTLRDLARFGLLFTPSWSVVSDEQIISDAHMDKILHGGRPEIFDKGRQGQAAIRGLRGERPHHNTRQWNWVMDDGDFCKGGFGGQGLYISPTRDLVIIYTGTPDANGSSNDMRWIARQLATSKTMS